MKLEVLNHIYIVVDVPKYLLEAFIFVALTNAPMFPRQILVQLPAHC